MELDGLLTDTIDFSGGDSNLYSQMLNDEVNYLDRTGLKAQA